MQEGTLIDYLTRQRRNGEGNPCISRHETSVVVTVVEVRFCRSPRVHLVYAGVLTNLKLCVVSCREIYMSFDICYLRKPAESRGNSREKKTELWETCANCPDDLINSENDKSWISLIAASGCALSENVSRRTGRQ